MAILLIILLPWLSGQQTNYPTETYTIEDGITHNSVLWIEKDKFGFMWVFTYNGLNRFDGSNFTQYPLSELDPFSFMVFSRIESDSKGELWLTNPDGYSYRYDFYRDVFYRPSGFSPDGTVGMLPFRASDGTLWRYDSHSVAKLKEYPDDSVTIETELGATGELGEIYGLFEFPENELWLNASSGLYSMKDLPGGIQLTRWTMDIDGLDGEPQRINRIIPWGNRFWLLADYRIMLIDNPYLTGRKADRVINGDLLALDSPDIEIDTDQEVYAMAWDPNGYLYFRTLNGVYRYAPYSKEAERIYAERYGQLDGGEGSFQLAMYYDPHGILWLGTDKGLVKVVTGTKNFHVIHPDKSDLDERNQLKTNAVLVDHRNHLWIGTVSEGLYRGIPDQHGAYEHFEHYLPDPKDPFSLEGIGVCTICEDSHGTIWINGNRIDLSGSTPRFLPVPYPYGIGQIDEDPEGNIVVSGAFMDCWIYNPDSGRMYLLCPEGRPVKYAPSSFYMTDSDQFFLETGHALYQLQGPWRYASETLSTTGETTGTTSSFTDPDRIPCIFPERSVKLLDHLGNKSSKLIVTEYRDYQEIWLYIYQDSELKRYRWPRAGPAERENDQAAGNGLMLVQTYSMDNGLSNESIFNLMEDNQKRIWCSTAYGLTCIDPETDQIFRYYEEDGLPTNKFYWGVDMDPEGNIYFCTTDGVVWFNPEEITQDPRPPVYIHGFRLFNKSVNPGPDGPLKEEVMFTDQVTLPYHQNFVTLEFTALDFKNPGKVRYQYRMEGVDRDWVEAGNRRLADYTNMRPGHYTFRVRAANGNGVWNREGASIGLRIKNPPWMKWWAFLIYVLIITLLVLWYRNFLLSRAKISTSLELERMEKEKIRELDHMKSRFFANISHELRTPLTLLLGPVEDGLRSQGPVIETKRDLFLMMQRNARRLQRLIDQLLSLSRLETGKMKLRVRKDDMVRFTKNIVLSFTSLAESRGIGYEINLPPSSLETFFDSDKLEKILTNLISNALKFTPDRGTIGIHMQFKPAGEDQIPETLEIKVSDTGKGIPADQLHRIFERFYQVSDSDTREHEGSGIGLALSKELVEVYRGSLEVESEPGKGTLFTLSLPVSRGRFREDEIMEADNETADQTGKALSDRVPEEQPGGVRKSDTHPDMKTDSRPVVLIVEDNEDLRSYISGNLEDQFKVLIAAQGAAGLNTAVEYIPDLIITDLMMPEMSGMEMTVRLKTDERTSHIPVIMLTARADRQSKLEGLETGADDYIIKPFDAEELLIRVKNLIDQRTRLRENFRWQFLSGAHADLPVSSKDQWMEKIFNLLNRRASEPDFNMKKMATELGMSNRQLFRKVQALTGLTPNHLLRNLRLKKAAALFDRGMDNVTEVMYEVGFTHHSYFAKCFRELYKINPSEYVKRRSPSSMI